jgi:uncharacterized membrane protein YedE/YeeE
MLPEQIFLGKYFNPQRIYYDVVVVFLIGFGSRYAGGCSGHSISGITQWPPLVATCCFFICGLIMANFILPFILSL